MIEDGGVKLGTTETTPILISDENRQSTINKVCNIGAGVFVVSLIVCAPTAYGVSLGGIAMGIFGGKTVKLVGGIIWATATFASICGCAILCTLGANAK